MQSNKKKIGERKRNAFLGVAIAILAATLISVLFHTVLCPNSQEYKIVIATVFALLIFITSSYYTIRTTDKQNMYNAYLQARMSIWSAFAARWFRNGNAWGMHYTKDSICFIFMFLSCVFMFCTILCSIFVKFLFLCWLFFIGAFIIVFIVVLIRLDLIDFRCFFSIYVLTKNFKKFDDFNLLKQWGLKISCLTLWMMERDSLGRDVRYPDWFKNNYDKGAFFADSDPKPAQFSPIWISTKTMMKLKRYEQKYEFLKRESDDDTIKRLLKESEEEK